MNKRSRHIAPFLFLGCILLPFLAVVFLQGVQGYLKLSAGQRMEKEKLVTIVLPQTALHWEKKNKELLIERQLFDVKTLSLQNGCATVTGFFDMEEDFIAELLSWFPHDKRKNLLLHLFLVLQCFSFTLPFLLLKDNDPFRIRPFVFSPYYLPLPFLTVLEQPPK
jgi:hypothetical protein